MSAQILKQLKIKTSTLRRLKKQYISYEKETKTINSKIEKLEASEENEDTQLQIKKNKQFLLESETVLSNVKQKLIEAFEALASFLNEKSDVQTLNDTQQKKQAEDVVLDAQTFLQSIE